MSNSDVTQTEARSLRHDALAVAFFSMAVRALCHPDFHYHNPATSTGGSGLALIVNGPIGPRLGINATNNVFGPGVRANATIGRARKLRTPKSKKCNMRSSTSLIRAW